MAVTWGGTVEIPTVQMRKRVAQKNEWFVQGHVVIKQWKQNLNTDLLKPGAWLKITGLAHCFMGTRQDGMRLMQGHDRCVSPKWKSLHVHQRHLSAGSVHGGDRRLA